MINLIIAFTNIFLSIFKSKKYLICEIALLKKEIEILKRKRKKRISTNHFDRLLFTFLNLVANIKDRISIVKPETLLRWQRNIIKRNWTFNSSKKKRERKPVIKEIQNLILSIKNDNILWGVKKIQGELINMNPYSERFVLSARREVLDNFIIINQTQLKNILNEYISYYNYKRPHQGINQNIPKKYLPKGKGKIVKLPILSGLHHHYYRKVA